MAIPANTLMEEAKCYLCLGISQAEALELALLARIAEGGSSSGARVYRALITQDATDPPVATILENTLGFTPVWSRINVGDYLLTFAGGFPADKTWFDACVNFGAPSGVIPFFRLQRISDDVMNLQVGDDTGLFDSLLLGSPIEILIYP